MSHEHTSDKGAAFAGLIVTTVALCVLVLGLVMFTNAKYAGHEGGKAEATQAH
ncbi:MAG: hypothetical protein IT359_02580 [Gemmatimonadaceae bacterium]|nr:hypothetical protein [Gemmatimonadaceae bacterium]